MSNETHPANPTGNGGYERSDISVRGVLYFLAGLAVFGALAYLAARGVYSSLDKRSAAEQAPVNPLVTNAPADTRRLPPEYKTDSESTDYEKYLEKNFPAPQLETDERIELTKDRVREENTLSTYDYVDKNAGTLRIPIERAMDLIAQRGLAMRAQDAGMQAAMAQPPQGQAANQAANQPANQLTKKKGKK